MGFIGDINMDKIFINDLQVETVIGIFDWEREIKQTISINLEMGLLEFLASSNSILLSPILKKEVFFSFKAMQCDT